jgi:hypothetical protein
MVAFGQKGGRDFHGVEIAHTGLFGFRMKESKLPPRPRIVMPQSSCQDLILASPGASLVDVMKVRVEASMSA